MTRKNSRNGDVSKFLGKDSTADAINRTIENVYYEGKLVAICESMVSVGYFPQLFGRFTYSHSRATCPAIAV